MKTMKTCWKVWKRGREGGRKWEIGFQNEKTVKFGMKNLSLSHPKQNSGTDAGGNEETGRDLMRHLLSAQGRTSQGTHVKLTNPCFFLFNLFKKLVKHPLLKCLRALLCVVRVGRSYSRSEFCLSDFSALSLSLTEISRIFLWLFHCLRSVSVFGHLSILERFTRGKKISSPKVLGY